MVAQSLKTVFRPLVRTALGRAIRGRVEPTLRNLTGLNPPLFYDPRLWSHCVSDAFVWRCDSGFQTRFDLMNLNSILVPEEADHSHILVVFFDQHGREIKRSTFDLEPFSTQPIFFEDMVDMPDQFGTFCVFHEHSKSPEMWPFETCMIERSYPGYKNNEAGVLWNYVHGCCNTIVLAYDFEQGEYYHLSRRSFRSQTFKPQLRFDDCHAFEIVVSNPLHRKQQICVRACDRNRSTLENQCFDLAPLASAIAKFENRNGHKTVIEVDSHAFWCRPLIFKHYESHFDALHS